MQPVVVAVTSWSLWRLQSWSKRGKKGSFALIYLDDIRPWLEPTNWNLYPGRQIGTDDYCLNHSLVTTSSFAVFFWCHPLKYVMNGLRCLNISWAGMFLQQPLKGTSCPPSTNTIYQVVLQCHGHCWGGLIGHILLANFMLPDLEILPGVFLDPVWNDNIHKTFLVLQDLGWQWVQPHFTDARLKLSRQESGLAPRQIEIIEGMVKLHV